MVANIDTIAMRVRVERYPTFQRVIEYNSEERPGASSVLLSSHTISLPMMVETNRNNGNTKRNNPHLDANVLLFREKQL